MNLSSWEKKSTRKTKAQSNFIWAMLQEQREGGRGKDRKLHAILSVEEESKQIA
jgi:hypothetical protein